MSDEMVDSEAEAPEKDSAASPTEGEEVTENTDESVASKETPTGEQKRLADTEAAIKERQREFHELSQKLAELKGQVSEMTRQNQPVVKDTLDDEGLAAKLRDDPSAVIAIIKERERAQLAQVAGVLEARDRYWQEQIEKSNPEVIAMREKIAELKKDPDLQGFTDQQLAIMARKSEPRAKYRGAPGGARAEQTREADLTQTDLYKKIYAENELLNPKKKA